MQSNQPFSVAGTQNATLQVNKVLKNTYMLLGMTLVFSGIMAGVSVVVQTPPMVSIVCSILALIMLFVVNRMADSSKGLPAIFVFTGLLGFSLGPLLTAYLSMPNGPQLIMQALGGTGIIFFALSGYALTTKKDFSYMGGFLAVGLLVAIVASIANIFFQIPALSLAVSSAIVLIMSGFILFDTSRIINGGETNYIRATVALYLNIYNLFIHLLHILGVMSDD